MWSQRWGLNYPEGDSQGFRGVSPTSVTTAGPGGIPFTISALENSHDLLWEMTGASCVWINQSLKTGIQQDEVQKKHPYPSIAKTQPE